MLSQNILIATNYLHVSPTTRNSHVNKSLHSSGLSKVIDLSLNSGVKTLELWNIGQINLISTQSPYL